MMKPLLKLACLSLLVFSTVGASCNIPDIPWPLPTPTPTPAPTPTPTPEPTPTPAPSACASLPSESALVPADPQRPESKTAKVKAGMTSLGDLSLPPGHTPEEYQARSKENLKKLAARLCAMGEVALAGIEAVFVLAEDGLWEEFHAVHFERGQWIPSGKYMGVHTLTGFPGPQPTPTPTPQPTPVPTPTPVTGCSAPLPPKVWTPETLPSGWGRDEIGKPRWQINCGIHQGKVDCTAQIAPRACSYCQSIGMGEAGGQPRCGCPVRSECPGFKCEERVACEAYLTGGTKLESRNGAECEYINNNPFVFRQSGGNCRLCSQEDPRVCGGWF